MSISISGSSYASAAASQSLAASSEALTSGNRINSAADDAAGLQISDRLTSEINGSQQAIRNGMDGISMVQSIDASLSDITADVQSLRELAVSAGNGAFTDADRQALQTQASELIAGIQSKIENASYGGEALLADDAERAIQVGTEANETIGVKTYDVASSLASSGLSNIDISDPTSLSAALDAIDETLNNLGSMQAEAGATQNAFTSRIDALLQGQQADSASRSRISDTDFAQAVSEQVVSQILEKSSFSVQAQANADSKRALSLLTN